MTLVVPLGLLALLTLPIILLLHLRREQRRRIAVPSLLHWLKLPRPPDGERMRRLPLTFLLLLHVLIAACIGIAISHPQIVGALSSNSQQIAVIIDTSTSMAARTGNNSRFDAARARARSVLANLGRNDTATVIAAGPTARVIASGSTNNAATFNTALDQLQLGGIGTDIVGALTLATATFDQQRQSQIVVISDNALAPTDVLSVAVPLDWQSVGDMQPNRAITTFAARTWGANVQVYARVANYADTPFNGTIQLYSDPQLLETRQVEIAANAASELTWTIPRSYSQLHVHLDGRDALAQDDDGFLNLVQDRPLNVTLVSATPGTLQRALQAVPGVNLSVRTPNTYTSTNTTDLTVFDSFLPTNWPDGASLAINPPANTKLINLAPLTDAITGPLMVNSTLLSDLSLESIHFNVVQQLVKTPAFSVQLAQGNTPLILRGRDGTHELAIWGFDLTTSNLKTRLAFPLLVARTVRNLTPPALPASVLSGTTLTLQPDPRSDSIHINGPTNLSTTVTNTATFMLDTLTQPGFYQIDERQGGQTVFRGVLAVNAGAVSESDLRARAAPTILVNNTNLGATAAQHNLIDLWPWLALGALALMMLEWGYSLR